MFGLRLFLAALWLGMFSLNDQPRSPLLGKGGCRNSGVNMLKLRAGRTRSPRKCGKPTKAYLLCFVRLFLPSFLSVLPGARRRDDLSFMLPWIPVGKKRGPISPLSMTPPRETRPHVVQQVTFKLAYSKKGNLKTQVKHDSEPKLCPEKKMTHQLASAPLAITCETALNTFTYSLAAG